MILLQQKVAQERSADKGGDNAYRDFPARHAPDDAIRQQQKHPSQQGGEGDQSPMIQADEQAGHVCGDQIDPHNDAAGRASGRDNESPEKHEENPCPLDVHAHGQRLFIPEGHEIESPSEQADHGYADRDNNESPDYMRPEDVVQPSHGPENDSGELLVGIGEVFQKRPRRHEKGRHNDAGDHQGGLAEPLGSRRPHISPSRTEKLMFFRVFRAP